MSNIEKLGRLTGAAAANLRRNMAALAAMRPHDGVMFRVALELQAAQGRADALGYRDLFDDVWVLGNEEMKGRAGQSYAPMDICMIIEKYDAGAGV